MVFFSTKGYSKTLGKYDEMKITWKKRDTFETIIKYSKLVLQIFIQKYVPYGEPCKEKSNPVLTRIKGGAGNFNEGGFSVLEKTQLKISLEF